MIIILKKNKVVAFIVRFFFKPLFTNLNNLERFIYLELISILEIIIEEVLAIIYKLSF